MKALKLVKKVLGYGVVVLAVLVLLGAAFAESDPATSEPEVVTETVEVPKTPEACLEALGAAEETLGYAVKGFGQVEHLLIAVSDWNMAGVDQAATRLGELTEPTALARARFDAAAAECRRSK